MRQEEALIGAVQFIVLPLTFLSATFLETNLMPHWIQHVSDFNPVNWAVLAGRSATSTSPDWGLVASRIGFLVAVLALCLVFATRAFRSYQRSVWGTSWGRPCSRTTRAPPLMRGRMPRGRMARALCLRHGGLRLRQQGSQALAGVLAAEPPQNLIGDVQVVDARSGR